MPTPPLFPDALIMSDFTYTLPDEKIARYPLAEREKSKLLVWKSGRIEESEFASLSASLPAPSLLVFNNSRVVEARILFQKPGGGQIEIFCLEPNTVYNNITTAMAQTGNVKWNCLIGGASKWKKTEVLRKQMGDSMLEARFVEKRKDDFIIEFSWTPEEMNFASMLHQLGSVPLPPYLKRPADISDAGRYQTVYARESGSVAAPTAGLHFSEKLLETLSEKNIKPLFLTLHVGAGTFMPVKSEKLSLHHMHEEFIEITAASLEQLILKLDEPVIAVGTTSIRTLETLYWLGLQISQQKNIQPAELHLDQWFPYHKHRDLLPGQALNALLEWIRMQPEKKLVTKTQLYIVPGYRFKIVKGLITNFHQPHSTLLLLVAAFIGPSWKSAYTFALEHDYRFLSYGDGCLFLP